MKLEKVSDARKFESSPCMNKNIKMLSGREGTEKFLKIYRFSSEYFKLFASLFSI